MSVMGQLSSSQGHFYSVPPRELRRNVRISDPWATHPLRSLGCQDYKNRFFFLKAPIQKQPETSHFETTWVPTKMFNMSLGFTPNRLLKSLKVTQRICSWGLQPWHHRSIQVSLAQFLCIEEHHRPPIHKPHSHVLRTGTKLAVLSSHKH